MLKAINKIQRSRLTFDFSSKVTHIWVLLTYQNVVFSETTRPIELKFHMKTHYDSLAKFVTSCSGYMTKMTKMTTTPIYGEKSL